MEKSTLKNMKFGKEKLKNIWFFYKKQIIAGLLVLAVGVVLFVQCAGRDRNDLNIYFAGPVFFSAEAQNKVCQAFEAVIDEKTAGSVGLIVTVIGDDLSPGATDEEKEQYYIDYTREKATTDDFKTRLRLPDTAICILSPECFAEAMKDGKSLRLLTEILQDASLPLTEDGYGIRLSALDFYKSNSILKNFPENSILCLKSPSIFRTESEYERQIEAFRQIVFFRLKDSSGK